MLKFHSDLPVAVPPAAGWPLGGALLGDPAGAGAVDWPRQTVAAPLFGGARAAAREIWLADAPGAAGQTGGIAWRRSGDLLYGVLELDEAGFADAEQPLQAASREAYRRIFRLLDQQGLPQLWRVWNYLADINGEAQGLERYRQFNIGRQDAFLEGRRGATGNVPAACAIGLAGGPLSIAFLAGAAPAVPLENPRQTSAYNYPADYGPRSPTFSRGALLHPAGAEILAVSGTASIVGHRTVHAGDIAGQSREALTNVAAVVAEANRLPRSTPFSLEELSYRVYIRHAADFAAVREALGERVGAGADAVYLQADICRADLLVEIEATALHGRADD